MDPATLYLVYAAATGGPEKRVVEHFDSKAACEKTLSRWHADARKSKRHKVIRAICLRPTDDAPDWRSSHVIIDDSLAPKHRP